MKKTGLFLSLGLALLASCANDDLVNPVSPESQSDLTPIGFNIRVNNMSRANPGLETVSAHFGVWAYKGADQKTAFTTATTAESKVMDDYLVGFYNGAAGYVPADNQHKYGTSTVYQWYYEGLGTSDNGYTWEPITGLTKAESHKANQYLKYWDNSANYTYFYGYAPYVDGVTISTTNVGGVDYPSLSFGTISGQTTTLDNETGKVTLSDATSSDLMYAYARVAKADYGNPVTMNFTRLLSQMRFAFYEDVPGYNVEIAGLSTSNNAVVIVPTVQDGATYTKTGAAYTISGTSTVYFTEDATGLKANVTYSSPTTSSANIYYPYFWFIQPDDKHSAKIGEGADNKVYSEKITVVPADAANPNCGFTLNVTLKFTAKDTGEVFYVHGARAYVPVDVTQWEANKLYTYVFKISKGVSGDTGKPNPDPGVGPNPDKALVPIIFEDVTIEEMKEVVNGEYNL